MAELDDTSVVVDGHDQVIAHTKFSEIEGKRDVIRRLTCVFLRNDAGEYLLAKRALAKRHHPGYWGPAATGGVESHETYEQNAKKELEEELGISDTDLAFVGNFFSQADDHAMFIGVFTGIYNGDIENLTLQKDEVDSVQWMPGADVVQWIQQQEKVIPILPKMLNALGVNTGPNTLEYAQVVDSTDTTMCYKPRRLLQKTDAIRTTSVWIEDGKGNALTQKRSAKLQYLPGLWDGAGGGMVNSQETPDSNACKEMVEELGLSDVSLQHVRVSLLKGEGSKGDCFCYWYTGTITQPIEAFSIQQEEVDEIKWVPKHELFDDVDANPSKYMPSAQLWRSLFE